MFTGICNGSHGGPTKHPVDKGNKRNTASSHTSHRILSDSGNSGGGESSGKGFKGNLEQAHKGTGPQTLQGRWWEALEGTLVPPRRVDERSPAS